VMLATYTGNVDMELTAAFATLAEANVREVVLDLRYNGGGFVNTAGLLCGLLSQQLAGTTYVQYTYNSTYKSNNRASSIPSLSNALRLTRVFVLVNGGTASASELTINALKPFIDVVIIGTPTVGKAVGSNFVFHTKSGYMLQPISFKFANARGEADFLNGFTPTRQIVDNVERDFGDPQELYLRSALTFIQSGSFPALSVKEMGGSSMHSSTGGRYVPEGGDEILPALAPIMRR
jgi:carboxyl-terminal processing protease